MEERSQIHVGLEVHKDSISVGGGRVGPSARALEQAAQGAGHCW